MRFLAYENIAATAATLLGASGSYGRILAIGREHSASTRTGTLDIIQKKYIFRILSEVNAQLGLQERRSQRTTDVQLTRCEAQCQGRSPVLRCMPTSTGRMILVRLCPCVSRWDASAIQTHRILTSLVICRHLGNISIRLVDCSESTEPGFKADAFKSR